MQIVRRVAAFALGCLISWTAAAQTAPDADALMDWAQRSYPILFPGSPTTTALPPYVVRYYSGTRNYIGAANGAAYLFGPITGNVLVNIGSLASFTCRVYPERCVSAPPQAEWGGVYTAYATHGERYTLTLDFSQNTYEFRGITSPGYTATGRFTPSGTARAYAFTGTPVANSGFRYVNDLVVGSFDFGLGTVPFVAARNFATTLAEAAGTYNNLGVTASTDGTRDSTIYASRIDAGGSLHICNNSTVTAISLCPFEAVLTYSLTLSGSQFTATPESANITGGAFTFRVATAGGDRTYLMATTGSTTGTRFFRIGVPESGDYPAGSALGGSTRGEWQTASFSSTGYSSAGIGSGAQAVSYAGSLARLGTVGPTGMRIFQAATNGFTIQNTQLAVFAGSRSGANAGYMQIGAK